jgi:hypothetical protein
MSVFLMASKGIPHMAKDARRAQAFQTIGLLRPVLAECHLTSNTSHARDLQTSFSNAP